jgi:hypothetical protein
MRTIENQCLDGERALYGSSNILVRNCKFDGAQDGESALKEASDILVEDTFCNLRYPFWHDHRLEIRRCEMTPLCRAALWYSDDVVIRNSKLHGIKALRECCRVSLFDCDIRSSEFGWSVETLDMEDCRAEGEYFLLRASDVTVRRVELNGKYSFQYVEGLTAEECELNTKDAFWHAKNVTVRNSVIRGEYLGWYSENLTLINCKIFGTQPFCYCKGLKLLDCEMYGADLAFEKSDVEATLKTSVVSIKNPRAGKISLPKPCELIMDDPDAKAEIMILKAISL